MRLISLLEAELAQWIRKSFGARVVAYSLVHQELDPEGEAGFHKRCMILKVIGVTEFNKKVTFVIWVDTFRKMKGLMGRVWNFSLVL